MKRLLSFKKERNIILLLLVWIVALSIAYSTLSIVRHSHFESGGFDLGIYDQGIWLYSRFEAPFSTIKEKFLLGDHLTLTLPILAPLFWIWDNVRVLLIAQAFFITFSSLAIYLLARARRLSPFSSLLFAIIYSLFYGIQYGVYFDSHPIVFAAAILAWLIYFYESRRVKLFVLSLALFLLTQENTGIALGAIGLIYFFDKKRRRDAVLFIFGGLLTSLAEVKIVSYFSNVGYEYNPHFSAGPIGLIRRYFDQPDKILVWKYSLASYSFLPLLSPGAILAMTADLSQYFLPDKEYPHMITPFFHHRVILAPILALGSLGTITFLVRKGLKSEYLLLAALIIASLFQFKFHHALNKLTKPMFYAHYAWMEDNRQILAKVPKNASVAAQQSLVPHLSHRKEIYLIWPRKSTDPRHCGSQKECWWLDFSGKPEYLVVDVHPGATLTQLLESRENFISALKNMEKAGKISIWHKQNEAIIYKVNY